MMPALPALGTVGNLGTGQGNAPGSAPEGNATARGESRFARLLGARKAAAEQPPATAHARPTAPRSGASTVDKADAQPVAATDTLAAADAQAAAAADPALAAQLALANPPREAADAAASAMIAVEVPAGSAVAGTDEGTTAGATEGRAAPVRVGTAASPALPPATGHAAAPQAPIDQGSTIAAATPGGAWSQALGAAAQATAADAPGATRPAAAPHDPSAANQAALSLTPPGPAPADMIAAASAEAKAVLRTALPGPASNDAAAAAVAVPATGQPARDVADLAAPALPVAMATPIDEPDFAAHLGAQVSLLAQGGVHKAELRLNPAHMGPVAVHIALDGTQARVEFGVDVAATRQAIEDGLPALAAAMREAGFTLSGGGVSQHPQGQARREAGQSGGDARPWPGNSGRDEPIRGAAALPAAAVRRVSLGHLDLYA